MKAKRIVALLVVTLIVVAGSTQAGLAQSPITINPGVAVMAAQDGTCMQDVAGFGLNCSANDVRLGSAGNIQILDNGCAYPGDDVTFKATFEMVLTAQARHDIGVYFAVDGDPDGNGALSGTCSASTPPWAPDPPWLDLDKTNDPYPGTNTPSGVQDVCGDIDAAHSPLYPTITITTKCIDPDGDGKLNLPYCTSWRQSGANQLCLGSQDAYPGAPSKCKCDLGYEVNILVPTATLEVIKTANPTSIDEPGGDVTFKVSVANKGIDPNNSVTLTSLVDDVYGNLNGKGTCLVPQTLLAGAPPYTCEFVGPVVGDAGTTHPDWVTATGTDSHSHSVSSKDDATVTILDKKPAITVLKTAAPTSVNEPGGSVLFTFKVTNTSVEPVTIASLTDTDFTLNGDADCQVGTILPVGGSCEFSQTEFIPGDASGPDHNDIFTATATDNEKNTVTDDDDATVTVTDVNPTVDLTKVADPLTRAEPGGAFNFTLTIHNTSIERVTITALTDDNALSAQCLALIGTTLAADDGVADSGPDQKTCTYTVSHTNPGTYPNTASVTVEDNELNKDSDTADATVTVTDVLPAAHLTKTPTRVIVTFEIVVYNDSGSTDPLTINSLTDDIYGDITTTGHDGIQSTNCALGGTVPPGQSYTCAFTAAVSASPQTDTVTAGLSDNELSPVVPSPWDWAYVEFN